MSTKHKLVRVRWTDLSSSYLEWILQKMQTTDKYREQNFLTTHTEMAKALGY
jgi:hypothetical protein